jgi:hypothetical protein
MNKTRQITIETHSITIIRTDSRQHSAHCEHCGKTVSAFPPEQMAVFLRLDAAEIYRRIESSELHLIKNGRGVALICAGSSENLQTK